VKVHFVMAASAVLVLLTSATFAANSSSKISHVAPAAHSSSSRSQSPLRDPRGGIGPEGTPRAGSRFSVMTGDEALMCKVAGNPSSTIWAPPDAYAQAIAHMRREGDIRCRPSMTSE